MINVAMALVIVVALLAASLIESASGSASSKSEAQLIDSLIGKRKSTRFYRSKLADLPSLL